MELTILIPAKNEKNNLPIVLDELFEIINFNFDYEILVVIPEKDDSLDNLTEEQIKKIVYYKQKNQGYGNAMIEGNHIAKGEKVIFCFSDGSSDPRDIKRIYEGLKTNDFVFCSRYMKESKSFDDTLFTYIGNKFFSGLGMIFFNLKISDILYTYFGYHKKKFFELKLESNDYRICVEIPILIQRGNFIYKEISAAERKRISGKTNVNAFKDGLLILLQMIKMFFFK